MNQEEILGKLHDIHMPAGQSAAVDHTGLWLLILALLFALFLVWLSRRRRLAWRRQSRRELQRIRASANEGETAAAWQQLSALLRRLVLLVEPDESSAGLTDEAWLARLDRLFDTTLFSQGQGRAIIGNPYRRSQPDSLPSLDIITQLVAARLRHLRPADD